MKFIVTKSNNDYDYDNDAPIKPYRKAFIENYTYVDYRNVKTLKEASRCHWYTQFMAFGTNHREGYLGEYVARDLGIKQHYVIEINSLEELKELYKETARLIISFDISDHILERNNYDGEIEIYNGYRE